MSQDGLLPRSSRAARRCTRGHCQQVWCATVTVTVTVTVILLKTTHRKPYTDKNLPCHLTTEKVRDALINMSNDSRQLILDYTIAHPVYGIQKRAELVYVNFRPTTPMERLFGAFFAQSRARLGAAVARGMALRALGCSSMGVSKVFLRHIAPTRYQDLTI
jgi:hypothetical protein